MRRYHIQDRDDYKKYNKLCGLVTKFVSEIKALDAKDPARIELTDQLLDKYVFVEFLQAVLGLQVLWGPDCLLLLLRAGF